MLVRLAIDFENPARRWWEAGGRALWESVAEGFDTAHVLLDESLAASWIARAAAIPGWDDGPAYAPHPVTVKPVESDEEL
jgi:hypothetical protein